MVTKKWYWRVSTKINEKGFEVGENCWFWDTPIYKEEEDIGDKTWDVFHITE